MDRRLEADGIGVVEAEGRKGLSGGGEGGRAGDHRLGGCAADGI